MMIKLLIILTALFVPMLTAGALTAIIKTLPDIVILVLFVTLLTAIGSYVIVRLEV